MVKDRHTYRIGDIHKRDNECSEVYKYETK